MFIYLYFGRNYIILTFNNYMKKIKYKDYNENNCLKFIINYCKDNYVNNLTIISNRLYYKINNIYNKDIKINWKIESKNKIKNQIEYIRIYKVLLDNNLL